MAAATPKPAALGAKPDPAKAAAPVLKPIVPGSPAAAKAAPPTPAPKGPPMKVRATADGYYANVFRRTDDVFTISGPAHFSDRWMGRVEPRTPEKITGAGQAALSANHDRLGAKPRASR